MEKGMLFVDWSCESTEVATVLDDFITASLSAIVVRYPQEDEALFCDPDGLLTPALILSLDI
jgi:hypothetical protein